MQVSAQHPEVLAPFKALIRTEFGLDFYSQNEYLLINALNTRLKLRQENTQTYYQCLQHNADELAQLVSLLTINETYFYREKEHLQLLTETLLATIQVNKPENNPIRIVSVGCSIGAEPYSIALALLQKIGWQKMADISILGADIDQAALNIARLGEYRHHAFRGLPNDLKQRYFTETQPDNFVLEKKIRDLVDFQYMNIAAQILPSQVQPVDIIFFRNVSIYFDESTRRRIQANIASMLKPSGYLVMGITESLSNDFGLLHLQQEQDLFYFCKDKAQSKKLPEEKLASVPPIFEPEDTPTFSPIFHHDSMTPSYLPPSNSEEVTHSKPQTIAELVRDKKYDAVLTRLNELDEQSVNAESLALQAFILFNRQDFVQAAAYAEKVLQIEPFSMDAFLLLGMIAKWQKKVAVAINWFKKALYLHPDCWPGHYYLAGLYKEQGHLSKAQQEYRLVLQQLDDPHEDFSRHISIPLSFPKSEIRLICQPYAS